MKCWICIYLRKEGEGPRSPSPSTVTGCATSAARELYEASRRGIHTPPSAWAPSIYLSSSSPACVKTAMHPVPLNPKVVHTLLSVLGFAAIAAVI